jgi:hypothetical protein
LYDRKEAARQLSISVRSLGYIIAAKGLATRRIGRKVLVTRASLVRYESGNHFDVKEPTAGRVAGDLTIPQGFTKNEREQMVKTKVTV